MTKTKGCPTCGWFDTTGGEPHASTCSGPVVDMNVAPVSTTTKTTIYVKSGDITILNQMAELHDCLSVGGRNIGKPSLSALLRAIAAGRLVVSQP